MPARKLKRARQQEVDVGLFELDLARFFEPFDERVLDLQLADEPKTVGEAVGEQQHEAVEIELESPSARSSGAFKWKSM